MRQLRTRLLNELGTLPKVYEYIGQGEDITYDKWVKTLRQFWIIREEAQKTFALLEYDSEGRVLQKTFTNVMRHPDAIMRMRKVCHDLVKNYGIVSRGFEGINLWMPLAKDEFVRACEELLDISQIDSRTIFKCLAHGPESKVQLSELLNSLTRLEEQHHRFLVPLEAKK